ncbi:MAG: Gfo/Idh/MocA family protein [Armatimonadota bacterium]|jgi:predicted dehydrogenase
MSDYRLVLIGTGQNMKGHLRSLLRLERVRIVGMADVDEERLAGAMELLDEPVPGYLDYRELLDSVEAEAALIAVPNYLHRQITCDCLDAGLHTLCEKPMATSVEDCDAMIEAAERNDRFLQIGLSCRFSRVDSTARRLVASGAIGEPKLAWAREFRPPFARKYRDWILDRSRSGGTLVEKTCHHFDLFNWFLAAGQPANATRVFGSGGADVVYADAGGIPEGLTESDDATVNVIDNALVTVDYDTGARAELVLCMFARHGRKLEIGIQGTEGGVVYYRHDLRLELFDERHSDRPRVIEIDIPDEEREFSHGGQAYLEQLYFFDCLRRGERPDVDGYVGKRSVEIALAAEESVQTGLPVKVRATPLPD